MNPTHSQAEAAFECILDESSALLRAPASAGTAFPDDDLHREILLPLLPAMLGDGAIRKHWQDQTATGFLARLRRHVGGGEAAPHWTADDFEIHVTASYTAGPDAKALADTLLSEEPLRDMAAALMNQILEAVWAKLPLPAIEVVPAGAEIAAAPFVEPAVEAAPGPEPLVAMAGSRIAAATAPRPILGLPPLPAAMLAQRLRRRAVRTSRENPISGVKIWRGRSGEPDWSRSYPLAGCTAEP